MDRCAGMPQTRNTQGLTVADPGGNRFTFTVRTAGSVPGDFDATMQRAADEVAGNG